MTLYKLHTILSMLVADGYGKRRVCIDKSSFTHALEADGATIINVTRADKESVPIIDDDGGIKTNKDGSERMFRAIVLRGTGAKE